jgi:uncharacterized protein
LISITFGRYGYTITGHANSGEHGKDIVCSAVSALALTGVKSLDDTIPTEHVIGNGNLFVEFDGSKLNHGELIKAITILDTIKTGMQLIANHYPQFVTISEEDYE